MKIEDSRCQWLNHRFSQSADEEGQRPRFVREEGTKMFRECQRNFICELTEKKKL